MTTPKEVCARIARRDVEIAKLEPQLDQAKEETKAASRELAVQLRYGSRLTNAIRGTASFESAMVALIDADKAALEARGK